MEKLYNLLAGGIVLAVFLSGCAQEIDNPEVDITSVRCHISQIDVEEDFATGILDTLTATKASFIDNNFIWSLGDKIGIIPNTGSQIYFAVNDGAGTSTAAFDGGDWAMKSTGTFYAYYPLYPDIFLSKDHVSVSYTGQVQSGNNNNLHSGDFWTLYTAGTTAVGNALNFSFNHLTSFFKTYVTVPAGTYTKITFSAPSNVFIKDGYFDLSAQTPTIVGTTMTDELSLDLQNVTFADETELTGYLVLAPVDITGIPITVTVYKDGTATYEYTLTKSNPMVPAKTYAFRATALTQLASSATEANALFAAGATSVSITEPLTEDMAIVLPNTSEAVTLILPTTASASTLTVSYPPAAESHPTTLSITGPEGADLDIRTPNSTVTVNGIAYDQVTSRTAANTCIIPVGVTVNNLKVVQGGVQVYGTVSQIDLSEQEDDAIINVSGTVSSLLGEDSEEYSPATGVSLNKTSINLNVGATETLIATVAPVGAYPNVIWTSSNDAVATVSSTGVVTAVATGSATITVTTISGGYTTTCAVTITGEPQYVDLGLSVLWATCNIGANAPEEFGDYYAWGEVETYYQNGDAQKASGVIWKPGKENGYDFASYKFYEGSGHMSKYAYEDGYYGWWGFDGKTVLEPEDDIANVIYGDMWRMPTLSELEELADNDNCTWTNSIRNGVSGMIVRSKKPGYTDKSIFFPRARSRYQTELYSSDYSAYWSSSLDKDYPNSAYMLALESNGSISFSDVVTNRDHGLFVRPVKGGSINLDKNILDIEIDDEISLLANVFPASTPNKAVSWTSSNPSVATVNSAGKVIGVSCGTTTITATATFYGKTATCKVTVSEKHTGVQLWADGPYWATSNVGAATSSAMGLLFSWGNVQGISTIKSSDDNYATSRGAALTDNIPTNSTYYDAASLNWCRKWRMPTVEEFRTLINADGSNKIVCTITANGLTIRGKGAYSGNSIFLPHYDGGVSWIDDEDWSTRYGAYWSRSMYDEHQGYVLYSSYRWYDDYDGEEISCKKQDRSRYGAVRPVHD